MAMADDGELIIIGLACAGFGEDEATMPHRQIRLCLQARRRTGGGESGSARCPGGRPPDPRLVRGALPYNLRARRPDPGTGLIGQFRLYALRGSDRFV